MEDAGAVGAFDWEGRCDLEGGGEFLAGVVGLDEPVNPASGSAVSDVLLLFTVLEAQPTHVIRLRVARRDEDELVPLVS